MLKIIFVLLISIVLKAGDLLVVAPSIDTECVAYTEFTTCYSHELNRSVYTVENLSPEQLKNATKIKRKDAFHEDPFLKTHIKNNLTNTKYDKGHMAASGNMSCRKSQKQSFSMANMIPQYYLNNRGNWRRIEEGVRRLVLSQGNATVVTGTYGSNGVIKTSDIPKYVFKVVKNNKSTKVYIITNDGNQDINTTTIEELSKASGYNFIY